MRHALAAVALAGSLALFPALAPAQSPPMEASGVPATQPANGAAREAAVVDLPVTRAVLFSSGVGYFEHTGEVDGNATMRLLFKAEQINDVLKSMVVMDRGDGHVSAVSYPSNEPIGRALRSFSVDLSGVPSLPDLLQQLRGAEVVVMAPERIEGKILSVEARANRLVRRSCASAEVVASALSLCCGGHRPPRFICSFISRRFVRAGPRRSAIGGR